MIIFTAYRAHFTPGLWGGIFWKMVRIKEPVRPRKITHCGHFWVVHRVNSLRSFTCHFFAKNWQITSKSEAREEGISLFSLVISYKPPKSRGKWYALRPYPDLVKPRWSSAYCGSAIYIYEICLERDIFFHSSSRGDENKSWLDYLTWVKDIPDSHTPFKINLHDLTPFVIKFTLP